MKKWRKRFDKWLCKILGHIYVPRGVNCWGLTTYRECLRCDNAQEILPLEEQGGLLSRTKYRDCERKDFENFPTTSQID